VVTYDDDKEALAAEYVLGTLSADERGQAEALLSIDPRFEEVVRQWERRLGELNVMVEAVEPSPQLWERVKARVDGLAAAAHAGQLRTEDRSEFGLPLVDDGELFAPQAPETPRALTELQASAETRASAEAQAPSKLEESSEPQTSPEEEPQDLVAAAVAAALELQAHAAETSAEALAGQQPPPLLPPPAEPTETGRVERGADVIYLASRLKRWRRLALACGAIAALLAVYVAVWQIAPELMPPQLRPAGAAAVARNQPAARTPQDRLVAVLSQEPTAPAFLLTLDTRGHTLTVRRVSAAPETGRSYQLWLISKKFSGPRSLGLVGEGEFTERALPGNYDIDTLRTASYAVSLEPSGGSPGSAPTGPVLFTGKAVDTLPASAPPKT
jgi:anti-sigma-K factor RskA